MVVAKTRPFIRVILVMLWGISSALYIAAKIHFFTRYDPLRIGNYLQEHSLYWAGMASAGLLIWFITKRLPDNH
jgi:hypothetical protein